jgi:hypothetical protein
MAEDDQTSRLKATMVKAMMKAADAERWKPIMTQLGLKDEDMVDRLVRLLLTHLVMDRTITALLTVKLIKDKADAFVEVENELTRINLSSRIRLAKACGGISDSCANDMHEVNNVRNQFSHYDPKLQGGLAAVKEIASEQASEKLIEKAIGTIVEVGKVLGLVPKTT